MHVDCTWLFVYVTSVSAHIMPLHCVYSPGTDRYVHRVVYRKTEREGEGQRERGEREKIVRTVSHIYMVVKLHVVCNIYTYTHIYWRDT